MAYTDKLCQFSVTANLINETDNSEYDISDRIKSIVVDKDYLSNIMPFFAVTIKVTNELRELIRNNEVKIALSVYETNVDFDTINSDEVTSSSRDILDNCFTTILKIYNKDLSDKDYYKDNDDDSDEAAVQNATSLITVECLAETTMEENSKIVNDSYYNASMDEILVDIVGDNNNDIYIDPSENKSREDTVLIPQQSPYTAITFLQNNYGLYTGKPIFFLDTDASYILEMQKYNRDYYKNKFDINVVPDDEIGNRALYTNFQMDEDYNLRRYINVVPGPVSVKDLRENMLGGTCIVGSYGSEYESISRNYNNSDNSKIRYYWNPGRKQIFENAFMVSPKYTLALDYSNINPKYISPITQYLLHCDTNELNGEYTLVENRFEFNTTDYKNYTCSGLITLTK